MPILARAGAAAAKGFGMLGKIAAAVDEYFEYVTLLLHGNGTNGAQNNTFLDSSTNNFTITRNGNTTQGTFTPYGSNWSNYFDGTGDYLSDIGTTSSFNFLHNTTALFTFECWVYLPSTAAEQYLFDNTNGTSSQIGCSISIVAGGAVSLFITRGVTGVGNVTAYVTSTGTVPTNQWVHVAVTYDQSLSSNNAKFYINGAAAGSGNKTGNTPSSSNASNALRIGCAGAGAAAFITGYISNLRIANSIVYSSAFTPSTSPLTAITNTSLLTCQSNRFIDNSSNNFTITRNGDVSVQRFSPFNPTTHYAAGTIGGSGYFDGSGDYLTTSSNTPMDFGTGAFTIEGWVYTGDKSVSGGASRTIIGNSGNSYTMQLYIDTSVGKVVFGNTGSTNLQGTSGIANSAWHHIAIVRSGTGTNQTALFVDGVREAVGTNSQNYTSGTIYVGAFGTTDGFWNGYISGFRIVKGTAVYDPTQTTLTVPTAPPTAITNTSLLLNFTNGGIIDNAMMNNLETVGNAQISTAQSKFGGGSLAFDGTGDYLIAASRATTSLEGNFTIEGWAYLSSTAAAWPVITIGDSSGVSGIELYRATSNGKWRVYSSNTAQIDSATSTSTGSWVHLAVVRSSGVIRLYVNGTNEGSTWSTTNTFSGAVYVAAEFNGGSVTVSANGYLDDLRITKGFARYTANFTAPTLPFPDQ